MQRSYAAPFAVFFVSALSDVADGVVARRWNARTHFGAIADPLADKLTMLTVAVMLAVQGVIPLWLAVAIMVRDLVIVGGALAYHCAVGRYAMAPTILSKLISLEPGHMQDAKMLRRCEMSAVDRRIGGPPIFRADAKSLNFGIITCRLPFDRHSGSGAWIAWNKKKLAREPHWDEVRS